MGYVTRQQIAAKIPPTVMTDALDDDGDGKEDDGLFDTIVANASAEVDGYLSGLFAVPFQNPPAKVQQAALAFTLEAIYQRRNVPDEKNPYASQARWWRNHLQKVGDRELPFDAAINKEFTPGASVAEPMKLNSSSM